MHYAVQTNVLWYNTISIEANSVAVGKHNTNCFLFDHIVVLNIWNADNLWLWAHFKNVSFRSCIEVVDYAIF